MAESPFIVEITERNYARVVVEGSYRVPVLVDFWASWCQPCQMLMPLLAKLAEEYQGRFILAKLNTEEQQAIAAQFGIRSIPTVKLFSNGQPVDEFMGALPEAQIRAFLDKHLPRASDGALALAEQHLMAGDTAAALAALQQAHDEDPGNPRVALALASTHATAGDFDAADAVLEGLPAEKQTGDEVAQLRGQLWFARIAADAAPPAILAGRLATDAGDSEARYQLAAHQVLAGSFEQAIESLLELMQRDRKFGDDAARVTLLKLFDLLGDDPMVTRYRARLFTLLH